VRLRISIEERHKLIQKWPSGYGQTGPYKEAAGYDVIIEGEAGLMHMSVSLFGYLPAYRLVLLTFYTLEQENQAVRLAKLVSPLRILLRGYMPTELSWQRYYPASRLARASGSTVTCLRRK
jgi:CoA-transferase family III